MSGRRKEFHKWVNQKVTFTKKADIDTRLKEKGMSKDEIEMIKKVSNMLLFGFGVILLFGLITAFAHPTLNIGEICLASLGYIVLALCFGGLGYNVYLWYQIIKKAIGKK